MENVKRTKEDIRKQIRFLKKLIKANQELINLLEEELGEEVKIEET